MLPEQFDELMCALEVIRCGLIDIETEVSNLKPKLPIHGTKFKPGADFKSKFKSEFGSELKGKSYVIDKSAGACCVMDHLYVLVESMALCNDMRIKPIAKWPFNIGINYGNLSNYAQMLLNEERDIFVDGEDVEAEAIVKKYGCQALHDFLNDVFDGPLTDYFIIPVTEQMARKL